MKRIWIWHDLHHYPRVAETPYANAPSTEYVLADDHAAALAEKDAEIERLEAWKREAIAVFESANLHEVGKALDVPLGGFIASAILPGIELLKENLAAEKEKVRELVECLKLAAIDQMRLSSLYSYRNDDASETAAEKRYAATTFLDIEWNPFGYTWRIVSTPPKKITFEAEVVTVIEDEGVSKAVRLPAKSPFDRLDTVIVTVEEKRD